jgi:xanthine dehydrogenase YagR molybdenum-binding subunit
MSLIENMHIGRATSRVDGRLKVTGHAQYAAEYAAYDLLYGYVVGSTIAVGRIIAMDLERSPASPGRGRDIHTRESREGGLAGS